MRILLCNDDGFQAQGIQTLARALRKAGHDVLMVAPSEERSGQSHAMSFFRPVLVREVERGTWSVHGTPADCAAIALQSLFKANPPDVVVSGINHGLNVGWDVNYSGTVGAATEASLLGHKAIAVSVDLHEAKGPDDVALFFERAADLTVKVVENLAAFPLGSCEVLNINHPGLAPKSLVAAACGGYSMYVPAVSELRPEKTAGENTAGSVVASDATASESGPGSAKVYMLGGNARRSNGDRSQDVTLLLDGHATFSVLSTRQSSTANTEKLGAILPRLV